jgi:hypothetical protein
MAAVVAIGVVFVGVITGSGLAYLGFRAYKDRRNKPVLDEERARNLEHTAQQLRKDTALDNVDRPEHEYHSDQWYGSPSVMPANVAPVAKPLPSTPTIQYTGGEGLVIPPERVFVSGEAAKGKRKKRVLEDDSSHQQEIHTNRGFDLQGLDSGYKNVHHQQLDILSPKPKRAVTPKVNVVPKGTAYDEEQERLSGYWDNVDNRKNIDMGRKPKNKLPKQSPLPAKFDEADMEDVDLNSTNMWKEARPAIAVPRKTLKLRDSFDSATTLTVANNLNAERPLSHVLSKLIEPEIPKRAVTVNRAAETKRKIEEAKKQRAEKARREQEERQAEERREAEEQQEREAEQQRRAEEEKQHVEEARAQTLAQMTGDEEPKHRVRRNSTPQRPDEVKHYGKYAFDNSGDWSPEKPQRQSTRRGSTASTDAKPDRKSCDKPFIRAPRRSNTFGSETSTSGDKAKKERRPSLSAGSKSRSMSMTERGRPEVKNRMPSIVEAYNVTAPSPVYRNSKRASTQQQRNSDGSNAVYSSGESRPSSVQAPRRSNTSSSDSPETPFTNENRDSISSKASKRSSDSSDPERKPSMCERAGSLLGRKGTEKETDYRQQAVENDRQRNSAGSSDGPHK